MRQFARQLILSLLLSSAAVGDEILALPTQKPNSVCVENSYPVSVFWGDTHVHTNLSSDAFRMGDEALGPEQAYRFAKGESVTAFNGMQARRQRPLDFLVVADHARNMGYLNALINLDDPELLATTAGQYWASLAANIPASVSPERTDVISKIDKDMLSRDPSDLKTVNRSVWDHAIKLADRYNQPGVFTAFIGYEWTATFNLHRVVVFKDNAKKAGMVLPLSAYDSSDPETLWAYMEAYEENTGGEILAIPHNGNLSNGVMFATETANGASFSSAYAKARSRWEPLLEVTQIKGDHETHPVVSPDDEFADYETKNSKNIYSWVLKQRKKGYSDYQNWYDDRRRTQENFDWMRTYEYARPALKLGLEQQADIGVNPFKFGMIGSTDSHTSLSTADENNFWGKHSPAGPGKDRYKNAWDGTSIDSSLGQWHGPGSLMNAAGYAAVWAQENTRESLFAAMQRKEVYASTGPRITVRFFGGWDFESDDAFKPDLAAIGYSKGVPMGGDLLLGPEGKSPQFLIRATKDPDGANLDRVQVIKGWHDKKGELHEQIYNVALSGKRQVNSNGKVEPVGNTVDIANAMYTNTIGDPELGIVWQDPDFDPGEFAFYYLRVIEIPTPRWTAYDAKLFGITDMPAEVPMIARERAYTSPIWYTPAN